MTATRRAARRGLAVLAVAVGCSMLLPLAAAGADVAIDTKLDGHVVRNLEGKTPVRLEPRARTPLEIEVTNTGDEDVRIRHVRLVGNTIGLPFLTYDLAVNQRVAAGETETLTLPLDLFDVDGQATGYLDSSVRLYDVDHKELAAQSFIMDVQGKKTSVLGLLAIALVVIAAISVIGIVTSALRRHLLRNRAMRGIQFMIVGAAVGLALAVFLPTFRLTIVQSDAWIPLLLGPMAIGFALGYLAPGPISTSIEQTREDELLAMFASQAMLRVTAGSAAAGADADDARAADADRISRPITADVPPGAPATTAAPAGAPAAPATSIVPDGRPSAPGTMVAPGGATPAAPGTVVVPGEARTSAPGTVVVPGEARTSAPGTVVVPGEARTSAPGTVVVPGEARTSAPGTVVVPGEAPAASPATSSRSQPDDPEPEPPE